MRFERVVLLFILSFLVVSSSFGRSHQVKKSETFYSISKKYGVTVKALMKLNGITDPRKLYAGKKLRIPSPREIGRAKSPKVSLKASRPVIPRSSRGKKSLSVIVDAGHGGRDQGAVWAGVREARLNLQVARLVESSLRSRGYRVIMTRRSDRFVSLGRRAQIANRYGNAVFVSIHFNATRNTRVRGAETFYAGRKGRVLASGIQREMTKNLKVRNRGVKYRRFSVLRHTNCPAVLVECGFISNPYERKRCSSRSYQVLSARSIVKGIERYDRIY